MNESPDDPAIDDLPDADGVALDPYASADVVELNAGATRIVCNWGRTYDFTPWRELSPVVALFAASFARNLSANENQKSAGKSNCSKFDKLRLFLRWWNDNCRPFGRGLLLDYKEYLKKEYRAATTWSALQAVFHTTEELMSRGDIPRFHVPPNVSQRAALNEGKGGETLAHLLPSGYAEVRDFPELNYAILLEMKQFCWENIRQGVACFKQGQVWRAEAEYEKLDVAELRKREPNWTWNEALETNVKLIWKYCDGFYPNPSWEDEVQASVGKFIQDKSNVAAKVARRLEQLNGAPHRMRQIPKWPGYGDVCQYIRPYMSFTCLFAPLFAEAGVNAEDIFDLQLDDIQPSGSDGRFAKIVWAKGRVPGAELSTPSLPVGGPDAPTVPRAWEVLVRETAEMRSRAPSACKDFLFIEGSRWEHLSPSEGTHVGRACSLQRVKTLREMILEQIPEWQGEGEKPRYHLLRLIAPRLSLSLIRTTAMNVVNHRSGRGVVSAQKFAGHSEPHVTDNYLNNPETKAAAEDATFEAQTMMEDWVRKPILVVPPTTKAVQEAIGVDAQVAQAVVDEECNLGFGISLINETQIVLDTPLNCLRMVQWLRKVKEAEERVLGNNPERWEKVWLPQIGLFEAALNDFSRRTLKAAKELDKEYDLPFPEVY